MINPHVVVELPVDNVLWSFWNERVRKERVISKERDTIEIVYFFCLAKQRKREERYKMDGVHNFFISLLLCEERQI
jgi:hypothetical protein